MNPYNRFSVVSSALYFLVVGISFTFIRNAIIAYSGLAGTAAPTLGHFGFDLALFVLVALASYVFVEHFLSPNLSGFIFFRKFILRGHYIEGTWIEDIVSSDGRRGLSILTITPIGSSISVTGSNYYYQWNEATQSIEDLAPAGISKSEMVSIVWPSILYTYHHHRRPRAGMGSISSRLNYSRNIILAPQTSTGNGEAAKSYEEMQVAIVVVGKNEGIGEMQFECIPGKAPQRFDGYFHHIGLELAHSFSGYKCTDQEAESISKHGDRILFLENKIKMLRSSAVYFKVSNSENKPADF